MFSVRIVTTDHYVSSPIPGLDVQYADQRGSEVKKVPVVRIFGATPAGQKTCMHVHGVFPYLYVPYDGTLPWDRYLRQFATSLDKAINVAQGQGQSNTQHVYKVVLVSGRSMYGYHEKDQQFLKIFMYNPAMIRKAADLLLGGAVLNKPFQPHESHIPYTLQLFIDYNLYGMNMINVAAVKFRRKKSQDGESSHVTFNEDPGSQGSQGSDSRSMTSFTALLNRSGSQTPSRHVWEHENIPSEFYLDADVERLSTCDLEVDVVAPDILNRLEVTANVGANPGLTALWEDERQRRTERGESTDIAPPESPGRVDIEASDSETILRERLRQIIQDLQPYIDSQSDTEPDESQEEEDDVPLQEASALDLHLSQDLLEGSQDTVVMDIDDEEPRDGEEAVVNVESIHRIVSHSQSFCDVRHDRPEVGSSQDKSLVDILAALADDHSSPPASQEAAARVLALEEQDSILSQTSAPPSGSQGEPEPHPGEEQDDEHETMEMSQRVWDGVEQGEEAGEDYDLAGMDDTWVDSQAEEPPDPGDGDDDDDDDDDDSDASSDIIPQYDGAVDEQPPGSDMKQLATKRLGMRGPAFNIAARDMSQGHMAQYSNRGNMANYGQMYGEYPGYPNPQQMAAGPRQMGPYRPNPNAGQQDWGQMYNQSNSPWPRGMYPQQQAGGMTGLHGNVPQQHPGMVGHDLTATSMQVSPGSSQSSHSHMKSPRSIQQLSPGSMHLDVSQAQHSMKLSPGGMVQSPGSVPHSPESLAQSPVYMPQGGQQQPGMMNMSHTSPTGSQQPSPGMNQYPVTSPTSQHGPRFPSTAQTGYPQYGGPRYYGTNQQYAQQQMLERRYMTEVAPGQQGYSQPGLRGSQASSMSAYQQSPGQFGQQRYPDPSQQGVSRLANQATAQAMSMYSGRQQQQRAQSMSGPPTSQHTMMTDNQHMSSQMGASTAFQHQQAGSCMMTSPGLGANNNATPSVSKDNMMMGAMTHHMSQEPSISTTKSSNESFMSQRANQIASQHAKQSMQQFPSTVSQPQPLGLGLGHGERTLQGLPSQPQSVPTASISASHSPGMESGRYVVKRPCSSTGSSPGAMLSPVEQNPNIGTFQGMENHRLGQNSSKRPSSRSQELQMKHNVFPHMAELSPSSQPSPSAYGMQTSNRMYQPSAPPYSHNVAQTTAQNTFPVSTSGQYSSGQSGLSPMNMPMKSSPGMPGNRDTPGKPQETYPGPVSRYYAQKKQLMYEQISPPATPGLGEPEAPRSNSQTPLSQPPGPVVVSTPNSAASDTQFSPLQKLLLEPSTPTAPKPDPGQRSLSRSSLSSVSSVNSERFSGRIRPSPDTGQASLLESAKSEPKMSTPDRKTSEKSLGSSRLYNLLSDNSSQGDSMSLNVQTNLNDSQQDLFADSLLNSPTDGNASNLSLFASDNSQSNSEKTQSRLSQMFDSFDSQSQSQREPQKPGSQGSESNQPFSITSKAQGPNTKTKGNNYGSLSNLQNFVGSVRQDTDYGVSFAKRERAFSVDVPAQTAQQSFLSQLNDFEDLSATFSEQQQQQQQQQQPQSASAQGSYNVTNWPKFDPADPNKPGRLPTSASTAKKRGRPPLKKSVSVPGGQVTTTMGKRKRGRPRKNSGNFVQPTTSFPSHGMMSGGAQQQFPMPQTMAGYQGSSVSNQYQTYPPGHQSFQQMLEDQGDQLPMDTGGFGGPMVSDQTQGPTMSQGPPDSLVASQPSQLAQSSQYQCNVQYQPGFQSNMQQQSQQSGDFLLQNLDFTQQQQQQSMQQFPSTVSQPQPLGLGLGNSGRNLQRKESTDVPQTNEGFMSQTDVPNFPSTVDMSQLYPDSGQSSDGQKFMNMDDQVSQNANVSHQQKMAETCGQMSQDFRPITLQSIKHQNTLVPHSDASRASAVSELIQYRIRPPPKPSPAYTYKFRVPTPVYKRMKIFARTSSNTKDVDFVRMHPKDARKYSLLKIGSEIVRLKNLPPQTIAKLQQDLKAGIHVASIPPALRAANYVDTIPKTSIIANLLSCDSPTPEETVSSSQEANVIEKASVETPAIHAVETPAIHAVEKSPNIKFDTPASHEVTTATAPVGATPTVTVDPPASNSESATTEEPKPNQNAVKKHRRSSEAKDRSMFKGNIANIPHLKKYRAGYIYFGKGHVGKGSNVKVRQNHPVLGPDFEDDENIVLKDVSLNEASEGTLTPIKSRTPIAGRSPAHSGGPMSEIEHHDKELLDSKLKSLELELDLNQSNNSQMFQDDLFTKEDMEDSEYEGSTEEETDNEEEKKEAEEKQAIEEKDVPEEKQDDSGKEEDADKSSSDLFDTSQESKSDVNLNDSKEDGTECVKEDPDTETTDVKMEESDINCDQIGKSNQSEKTCNEERDISTEEIKIIPFSSQDGNEIETIKSEELVSHENEQSDVNEKELTQEKTSLEVSAKDIVSALKAETCRGDTELLSEIVKLNGGGMIDNQEVSPANNQEVSQANIQELNPTKEIDSCDSDISKADSVDGPVDTAKFTDKGLEISKPVDIPKFTDENVDENKTEKVVNLVEPSKTIAEIIIQSPSTPDGERPENHPEDILALKMMSKQLRRSRSRSSSCESYCVSSRSGSRRSSLARSSENLKFELLARRRENSETSENKTDLKRKKKPSCSNSSASGSKSSRSSSVDKDYKRRRPKAKKKKKAKKRNYRTDSDSDGIPGVDYIVIGRFKGYKEMRVVVDKLALKNAADTVNVSDIVEKSHRRNSNGFHADSLVPQENQHLHVDTQHLHVDTHEDEDVHSDCRASDSSGQSLPCSGFSAEFEKFLVQQGSQIKQIQSSRSPNPGQSANFPQDPFLELRVEGGNSNEDDNLSESKIEKDHEMDVEVEPLVKPDGSAMTLEELTDTKSDNDVSEVVTETVSENEVDEEVEINEEEVKEHQDEVKETEDLSAADTCEDTVEEEVKKSGESKLSSSCSCGSVCVCGVTVNVGVTLKDCSVSLPNIKDMSSTTDDEKEDSQPEQKKQKSVSAVSEGNVKRKKKSSASNRLGNAFCTRSRRKKSKPKVKSSSSKLMSTLSALHSATLEQLTLAQALGESSVQSPVKTKDLSDIDSPTKSIPKLESPDFELYTDKTDDYRSDYTDTMCQLAYTSPPLSVKGNNSPPQPLSPDEMKSGEDWTAADKEVGEGHPVKPNDIPGLNLLDIDSSILSMKTKEANKNGLRSDFLDSDPFKESPVKTAVAKEAPMTLMDIKSMSKEEVENAHGLPRLDKDVSSPPDLGPPEMESFSPYEDSNDDSSPPPHLTPKRLTSQCDDEAYLSKSLSPRIPDLTDEKNKNMPLLTPCRSPRIPLSPRQASCSEKLPEKPFPTLPPENESKSKPGRSPGASSSTGSINVVHSEQFSDISDESEVEEQATAEVKPKCEPMSVSPQSNYENISPVKEPYISNISPVKESYVSIINSVKEPYASDKEQKLKEIKEFEERLKKSDENRNNIFELFKQNEKLKSQQNDIVEQQPSEVVTPLDFSFSQMSSAETTWKNEEPQDCSLKNRRPDSNHRTSPFAASKTMDMQDNIMTRPIPVPHQKDWMLQRKQNFSRVNGYSAYPEPGEVRRDFHGYPFNSSYPYTQTDLPPAFAPDFSQRNIFDNFSPPPALDKPYGSSHGYDRGAGSADLFDSLFHSSHSGSMNSYHSNPSFHRSLSDSFRPDYSIIRDSKMNDTILRMANHISLEKQRNSPIQQHNGAVPMLDLHGGRRKHQRKYSEPSGGDTSSSSSQHTGVDLSLSGSRADDRETAGSRQPEQTRQPVINTTDGCQVITPLSAPPTRDSIQYSAFDFGLPSVPQRHAFYSDYRDAPHKPREGGAQVLKVPSTLVKDLEEFETRADITGLHNRRAVLCLNDSMLASQEGTDTVQTKLQKEPALKYALTGDQPVIITPCLLPPCKLTVDKWFKGRKLYKDLKNEAIQKDQKKKSEETVSDKEIKGSEKTKSEDKEKPPPKSVDKKKGKVKQKDEIMTEKSDNEIDKSDTANEEKSDQVKSARLNLFTGKRELLQEEDKSEGASDNKYTKILKLKNDDTADSCKSPDGDTSVLHSTPLLRRTSTDLFEPGCTPITSSGRRGSQEGDAHLTTPRRRASGRLSSRRLSVNTESTLRQAILTSQMKHQFATPVLQRAQTTQIEGPSLKNSFGFRVSQQNYLDAKALHEFQHLTTLSMELHVETRGSLRPDPEIDAVQALFYTMFNDVPPTTATRHQTGMFIVDPQSARIQADQSPASSQGSGSGPGPSSGRKARSKVKDKDGGSDTLLEKSAILGFTVVYVKDEKELLHKFIDFVLKWDPDIFVGYEIQMLSWGYLLQRASSLSMNLAQALSRIPSIKKSYKAPERDEFGTDVMSEINIAGRIVLNLWRVLRHEVTLNVYSFENVAFHVLHKRIPLYPFRSLTTWFKHRTHLHRWKVVEHYVARVKGNMEMIDQLDLIGRTSEFARVFGIEFYHVLSRGSQYRVESMMLRVAKPLNYIPASPSVHQRARMKAPECIPLTLEPESRFYTDPVVVLDFQSLYPSIMIAYNYCFTTCLGRLEWFQKAHEAPIEFGCISLDLPPSDIKKCEKNVTISPNGIVFCTSKVKRGVLPTMVEEILKTRLMVKKAMKSYKGDKTLSRILNARQLGLKLIANVTYGYTAANFSGRMPCIEVGDSIVRKARETLERSIKLVEDTPRWGAKVIYGDTDSMFLLMKGRSKAEAFKIGQEIADTVTQMFPKPIKLKFEKVYLPCVLQTKKRYVGFMYETPDQKEPVYDAKGIETVRRDSCAAVSKMLEQSIKTLFTTHDVSAVKRYVQRQIQKIMEGTVSLQDFIFAKEYRGMSGYKPGACVPALEIAKKCLRQDKRAEPRTGERVPYIIVYGSPGLPLIQLVRQPLELISDPGLRLNATYYITKQILPPLDRFLFLLGVDVFSWYQDMPHSAGRMAIQAASSNQAKKGTISQYFATSNCPICEKQTKQPVCADCMKTPQLVCVTLNSKITHWERVHRQLQKICASCTGCCDPATFSTCISLDCPVLYRLARARDDLNRVQSCRDVLDKVFK